MTFSWAWAHHRPLLVRHHQSLADMARKKTMGVRTKRMEAHMSLLVVRRTQRVVHRTQRMAHKKQKVVRTTLKVARTSQWVVRKRLKEVRTKQLVPHTMSVLLLAALGILPRLTVSVPHMRLAGAQTRIGLRKLRQEAQMRRLAACKVSLALP